MKTKLQAVIIACAGMLCCACQHEAAQPSGALTSRAAPTAAAAPSSSARPSPALLSPEKANEKAPEVFSARFATTKGDFTIEVHRDWSPRGVDRFYNLVKAGYFDGASFFRAVQGFMVQFGIHSSPEVNAKWRETAIPDDPPKGVSNLRGHVTFAMAGPNTRTTQLFINYRNNAQLDGMGFTPFGQVTQGMEVVDSLYTGYGDMPAFGGRGPDQGRMQSEGDAYLKKEFPLLDSIKTARLIQ